MKMWMREHGPLLANAGLFVAFLVGMTFTGWNVANNEALRHGESPEPLSAYLVSGDFYEAVFENWESEFMVVALLIGAAVYLRQRGSGESKPVHAPHSETAD